MKIGRLLFYSIPFFIVESIVLIFCWWEIQSHSKAGVTIPPTLTSVHEMNLISGVVFHLLGHLIFTLPLTIFMYLGSSPGSGAKPPITR